MSITTIQEEYLSYGMIRYFDADKCLNSDSLHAFNKGKIISEEIVTFDCGLKEAVLTQLKLNDEYPDESHAYCELIEIWRYQTK